jgi:TolB-like protein
MDQLALIFLNLQWFPADRLFLVVTKVFLSPNKHVYGHHTGSKYPSMNLVSELRRRNVFGMVVLYIVGAWLVIQIAETIFPGWHIPDSSIRYVWFAAFLGLPIALLFSWRFDVTGKGVRRTPSKHEGTADLRLNTTDYILLIVFSVVAVVMVGALTQNILDSREPVGSQSAQTEQPFNPPEKTIGVLAFKNMSDDPEQGYFSEGVAEEVMHRVAQIKELKVIARETMWRYKDDPVGIGDIARELNIRYVLEGSVRRSGDQMRITAQLIDGIDNSHAWSQSYDRELTVDNLFEIQSDIASAIAGEMKITIDPAGQTGQSPTGDFNAHDAYLRALQSLNLRENDEALRHLKHALRLDENFAPAHTLLATVSLMKRKDSGIPWEELKQEVVKHYDRADELQPGMAETHRGRSYLAFLNGDLETALVQAQKAVEIKPNYLGAMNQLQITYRRLGRYAESEALLREMLLIDPLNVASRANYIEVLYESGRCEEAHEQADQLIPRRPDFGYGVHTVISGVCEGKLAESLAWDLKYEFSGGLGVFIALGEFAEVHRTSDDTMRPYLLWLEGSVNEAIEMVDRRVRQSPEDYSTMDEWADLYYFVRRFDKALPLYEQLLAVAPTARPIGSHVPLITTLRFAYTRRISGDEAGAQEIADIAREDFNKQYGAGKRISELFVAGAMIAVLDDDPERAIAALRSGIRDHGLRMTPFFEGPIFDSLRNDPGFIAVRAELDQILEEEHHKVLQLICFNNPAPNDWRPLPETCEGVVPQPVL